MEIKMWKTHSRILIAVAVLAIYFFCDATESFQQVFPKEALPTQSGYLSIKEKPEALMFYAYYEAMNSSEEITDTPIVLWLQGGQGCSSMAGNFYQVGPWRVQQDGRLHRNPAPWNRLFGLLFLDSPIGSGFSIAPSYSDIPLDEEQVARDLYSALQAFFSLNPFSRSRPFYITGQSYTGKYAPSLAYYMAQQIENGSVDALRVDGLAIGDGWHPVVQVRSPSAAAHAQGLIDFQQKLYLEKLQQEAVDLTLQQKWKAAANARKRAVAWLQNATDLATLLDARRTVLYEVSDDGTNYISAFLNEGAVKEALHVRGDALWKPCNETVARRMEEDSMKSSKWTVQWLVRRMPVLLYEGQFDLMSIGSTEEWMRSLDWNGLSRFWDSERVVWKVSGVLAGYVRSYSNLSHVVVVRAGYLAPADQSGYCQMMIESWVNNYSTRSSHSQA